MNEENLFDKEFVDLTIEKTRIISQKEFGMNDTKEIQSLVNDFGFSEEELEALKNAKVSDEDLKKQKEEDYKRFLQMDSNEEDFYDSEIAELGNILSKELGKATNNSKIRSF